MNRRRKEPVRFVESRMRVRYKETDQMAVAHHSNYLAWFEVGRTDLCREAGISYREIEERGFILVVTEATCRYRIGYRYDDEVLVRTSVAQAGSRIIRFHYDLLDSAGEKLHADGSTSHVWLDRATRRPTAAPEDIVKLFVPYVAT